MRLSTFINNHQDTILDEWDQFAKTLFSPEDKRNHYLLRDHARELLLELIADMTSDQSPQQEVDKSKGVVSPFHADDNAANVHGVTRHDEGFSVSAVVAEFRALRASILRMWLPNILVMSTPVVIDIIRFNESIDQLVADSIVTYKEA
ncbi:MAG: RsbRD N-terminal domain-containing protein [Rhizobacter sp.]|nr:RsbRD N-terminal domain-containing protein [Burkholderiales bacterium]